MTTRPATAARDDAVARVRAAATRHVDTRNDLIDTLDELAAAHEQAAAAFHHHDQDRADRHADAAHRCVEEATKERGKLPKD